MSDEHGRTEVCLLCGVVGTANAGDQSIATAATDTSSVKSKESSAGSTTDDANPLIQSTSQSFGTNEALAGFTDGDETKSSVVSKHSDIKDRIVRSSFQVRRESPRGDPPAVQGYTLRRRQQLEVEDSRKQW